MDFENGLFTYILLNKIKLKFTDSRKLNCGKVYTPWWQKFMSLFNQDIFF